MRAPSALTRRTASAVVAVVAGLVFANSLSNGFAWDDMHIVVNNGGIHRLATLPDAMTGPYWPVYYGRELGLWRPVTTALLGLQYVAGEGAPFLFHLTNVALHVLASVLTLLLLAELMPLGAALAGALVFAVHPVHVEAVANVIGVAEILSTTALVAACLVHVRVGQDRRWQSALAVGLLYAIGFGAKESAVTLPGLIFLVDAVRRRIGFRELPAYLAEQWRTYAAMAVVSAALLAGRFSVLGTVADPLPPIGAELLREIPRIWTLGEVWSHYVRLWVFPLDLSSDYAPAVIPISIGWHAANSVGIVLALGVLATCLVAWRRPPARPDTLTARMSAFGVVWFMVAISPVSNVVFLSGVLLAERTLYLPSVGLAAATGWLVARLARDRQRAATVALTMALGLASVRTWTRSPTWVDNESVAFTLVEQYPQSGRSQWILGDAFLGQGRVSDALRAYRAAIDLLGMHYPMTTEIARQLMWTGHLRAAERLLEISANNEPRYPMAWGMLAQIRSDYGDLVAAERYARLSLEREGRDAVRHHLLAWSLAAQGRWAEAREVRSRAEALGPSPLWQRYMYEAYSLREGGDTARAVIAADSAWVAATTDISRATVDSVRMAEFGLEPPLTSPDSTGGEGSK